MTPTRVLLVLVSIQLASAQFPWTAMEATLSRIETRLSSMEEQLSQLGQKMSAVETKLSQLETEMKDVNECASTACQNGGTCNEEINRYTCDCAPGYTGDHCQTNIDDCASGPCQNGGTCSDGVNQYTCHCVVGYTGNNCETVDPCADLTPTLARSVSLGAGVDAVTTLGDEVFAVQRGEDAVRVYDAATLAFKRHLSVPGFSYTLLGLVANDRDNHLYVTGLNANKVFKVQLPNGPVTTEWNVGSEPTGIAINRAQNLIVNVRDEDTIKEYTPNGTLVRQVPLPSSFQLRDIAQLPGGQILVSSDYTPNHTVLAVVEADGTVVKSYTGSSLRYGKGFDVFENGYIIAADEENNRMLIVNPTLTSAQELSVSGLSGPYSVAIDESRGRVYFGEWTGSRLVMLENVFGQCLAF